MDSKEFFQIIRFNIVRMDEKSITLTNGLVCLISDNEQKVRDYCVSENDNNELLFKTTNEQLFFEFVLKELGFSNDFEQLYNETLNSINCTGDEKCSLIYYRCDNRKNIKQKVSLKV